MSLGEWRDNTYYVEGLEYKFPKRPPLSSIRNHELTKKQQIWKRREEYLDYDWEGDWESNLDNLKFLEEELTRIYDGEWIMIGGVPTYINGMFYFFLQWYMLPDTGEYPDYRDTSLYYYRFLEIICDTKLCTGETLIKGRRLGATSMIIAYLLRKMLLVVRKTFGITSKSAEDANSEGAFGFLTSAFESLPVFLKPDIPDKETPKKVLYFKRQAIKGKTKGEDTGLNNRCFWRAPGMNVFDSGAYEDILCDESGKYDLQKTKVKIDEYLPIVTKCVKKGAKVTGKLHLPTTINPPEKGGANYRIVWDDADQSKADYLGQTKNGLYRIIIPAYYGFAGYIDRYGNSVVENPTPEQTEYLKSTGECPDPTIGAKQYQALIRKSLENNKEKLQQEIQMNPWDADEVFEAANDRCIFELDDLNKREKELIEKLEEMGRNPLKDELGRRGWFHKIPSGKVKFVDDPEGLWYIHKLLSEKEANRFEIINGLQTPTNEELGAAGLDPIRAGDATVDKGSDACLIIRNRYNSLDPENTGIPIAMFLGRMNNSNKFHEQIYNGLIYYGVKMLAERSPLNWLDYAEDNELKGYLYGTKRADGSEVKGIPNQQSEATKQEHAEAQVLASLHDIQYCPFITLIRQRKNFNVNKRTLFDTCMGDGYASMALKIPFKKKVQKKIDIRKLWRGGKIVNL